ncbi:MAG: hypothetical protein JWL79_3097 [Frankiales bacterium]|nr:hypothetical protein [Frankiales bacterium]
MALNHALDPLPEDANTALAALGLVVDDLLQPIRAGIAGRRATTQNHPRSYAGWRDYGERTAALREGMALRGFRGEELEGVCLTVHPKGDFAIMTAPGNHLTGTGKLGVTTRRKRGKVTQAIVKENAQLQLELELGVTPTAAPAKPTKIPTWVLLVFIDEDEVHSEFSLAAGIGEDGFIDSWTSQIPLPVIRLNDVLGADGDDDGPENPEIAVEEL